MTSTPPPNHPATLAPHLRTGQNGEETAVHYLREMGYRIMGCNVRLSKDEIDIMAFDPEDNVLVFAEVKTRKSLSEDFAPELNLTFQKKRNLFRSARTWVAHNGYEEGWRIDVLCVADGKVIDHWKEIESDEK
jgi:putative endonuclease